MSLLLISNLLLCEKKSMLKLALNFVLFTVCLIRSEWSVYSQKALKSAKCVLQLSCRVARSNQSISFWLPNPFVFAKIQDMFFHRILNCCSIKFWCTLIFFCLQKLPLVMLNKQEQLKNTQIWKKPSQLWIFKGHLKFSANWQETRAEHSMPPADLAEKSILIKVVA